MMVDDVGVAVAGGNGSGWIGMGDGSGYGRAGNRRLAATTETDRPTMSEYLGAPKTRSSSFPSLNSTFLIKFTKNYF